MKNNISIIGEELAVFYNKFDTLIKVGALKLSEKDLLSEMTCIDALQKAIKKPVKGAYSVHHDEGLFASFNIEVDKINSLHKRSEFTGVVMPCWQYFEQ
jgi:hypothetical protein